MKDFCFLIFFCFSLIWSFLFLISPCSLLGYSLLDQITNEYSDDAQDAG